MNFKLEDIPRDYIESGYFCPFCEVHFPRQFRVYHQDKINSSIYCGECESQLGMTFIWVPPDKIKESDVLTYNKILGINKRKSLKGY